METHNINSVFLSCVILFYIYELRNLWILSIYIAVSYCERDTMVPTKSWNVAQFLRLTSTENRFGKIHISSISNENIYAITIIKTFR